jgi:type I restriction enzyme S subunit
MLSPKAKRGLSPRPYLANYNVQWGRLALDAVQEMDFDDDEFKRFELRKGDLLVCEGGEVGRAAIWNDEVDGCCYQKALHRLRPRSGSMIPEFMLQFFFWADRKGKFAGLTGHSTIAHLTAVKLRTLKVATPPLAVQEQFVALFRDLDAALKQVESHLNHHRILKQSVLQREIGNRDVQ